MLRLVVDLAGSSLVLETGGFSQGGRIRVQKKAEIEGKWRAGGFQSWEREKRRKSSKRYFRRCCRVGSGVQKYNFFLFENEFGLVSMFRMSRPDREDSISISDFSGGVLVYFGVFKDVLFVQNALKVWEDLGKREGKVVRIRRAGKRKRKKQRGSLNF